MVIWALVLTLAGVSSASEGQKPLSFGRHYLQALKGEGLGTLMGLGVGAVGSAIAQNPGPVIVAIPLGNTVGTAMGANLATDEDEANGSLAASWTGAVLGGGGFAVMLFGAGTLVSGTENGSEGGPLLMGAIGWTLGAPLVATAAQRLFRTDDAPQVGLWSPSGRYRGDLGLRLRWSLP